MVSLTWVVERLRALWTRHHRGDLVRMPRPKDDAQLAIWENEGGKIARAQPPSERGEAC
jgi:hypothetical protein